ncbi:phosphatase PAP2 family protein [Ancylomarina euxinus]|uniref:Phosphatase PAP2 family protein n=1 Tax=Ancylomarina euxinus TaxID=2283627 RepID=A0A425Y5I8_9BACT|nr:phosphatase PAP2 family protein [Ancylomarina euxinus]MCZ4694238.1 phosphatase PAP2 family protein [Ancylomarina euxinus]MUP14431.1 phosphatase PAP2 family protein [Ancylomarina euxinus]RRG23737.1 phosphatase PAP2 family protein [Ancylomarina euxinus]
MLETLNQLDQELLLFLNGIHSPFFDSFMFLISGKLVWAAFYLSIIVQIYRTYGWKNCLYLLVAIILVIVCCDQMASGILKPTFQRFRPSRSPELADLVHTVNGYRGGKYGFASSHAANVFGLATFCSLLFRNRKLRLFLFSWAILVSYSRIYLGVHYPGDIIVGTAIGLFFGYLIYKILPRFKFIKLNNPIAEKDWKWNITSWGSLSIVVMAIIAIFK